MFPDGAIASCFERNFSSLREKNKLSEMYFVCYDEAKERNSFSDLKERRCLTSSSKLHKTAIFNIISGLQQTFQDSKEVKFILIHKKYT